jgi:hypothetical protein
VLAFITLDVRHNLVCLEMFKFYDSQMKHLGKRDLFDRGTADAWNMAVDKQRKFITFFLYHWDEVKSENMAAVRGYFINLEPTTTDPLSNTRPMILKTSPHKSEISVARQFDL